MTSPFISREALENLWRNRLQEAQRRFLIAKAVCADVQRHAADSAESHFAFSRAVQIEAVALQEYRHALTLFTDLTVKGKMPPAA